MEKILSFIRTLPPKTAWQWFGFAVIAAAVFIAYSPSLNHQVRADSIPYFKLTANQHTFHELVIANYDLNRKSFQADVRNERGLFRPLLYAFLGLQRYYFGDNFYAWHLTGILLHLLVIFWFLKICLELAPGLPAMCMALLFGVFYPNIELVIWENISAYLLAMFLLLVAVYHTIKLMRGEGEPLKRLGLIAAVLAVGVFIYEPLNVYAGLIGVGLWVSRPDLRNKLFLILLPLLAYAGASLFNYFVVNHLPLPESGGKGLFLPAANAAQMIGWWVYSGLFFPLYPLKLSPLTRDGFYPADTLVYKPLDLTNPLVVAGALVGACAIWLLIAGRSSWRSDRLRFSLLMAGFACTHAFLVAVTRVNQWGLELILANNIYHQYIFWLFMLLLMCGAIDWRGSGKRRAAYRQWVFASLVGVFSVGSASQLFITNYNLEMMVRELFSTWK